MLNLFIQNVHKRYNTDISFYLYNVGGYRAFRCYYDVFIKFGYSVMYLEGDDTKYKKTNSYGYQYNNYEHHIYLKGRYKVMSKEDIEKYKSHTNKDCILMCFYKRIDRKTICEILSEIKT